MKEWVKRYNKKERDSRHNAPLLNAIEQFEKCYEHNDKMYDLFTKRQQRKIEKYIRKIKEVLR